MDFGLAGPRRATVRGAQREAGVALAAPDIVPGKLTPVPPSGPGAPFAVRGRALAAAVGGSAFRRALARSRQHYYALYVHNLALLTTPEAPAAYTLWRRNTPALLLALFSATQPVVRAADDGDIYEIADLVNEYAADGLMLPRTPEQVARELDHYVVAADQAGRVLACAALSEYSPSLAEVSSVAVARSQHGKGLGTRVVRGIEEIARMRDVGELFALSLQDGFFASLGYEQAAVERYPEKLARWAQLAGEGVDVVPKRCFRKVLAAC